MLLEKLPEEEASKLDVSLQQLLETSKRQQIVQNLYYSQESVIDVSLRSSQSSKDSTN